MLLHEKNIPKKNRSTAWSQAEYEWIASLLRLKFQVISELKEKLSKASETDSVNTRGNCKQCPKNTLALLGKKEYYHPQRPGTTHSARWMGQLLHIQKMFMLSDQLPFTTEIMPQMTRMIQFLVLFYTTSCLNTSLGADASYNDLKFIYQMMDYEPWIMRSQMLLCKKS